MTDPRNLSISEFDYPLSDEQIALHPLEERDASRLLVYRNGEISDSVYRNLYQHLPANSLLVFNDTRVIRARILFQKPTGGIIEIFCLEPAEAINDYQVVMNKTGLVRWKCMIGGAGKWKSGPLVKFIKLEGTDIELQASLVDKLPDAYVVEFKWQPEHISFATIIEEAGDIPLPPYIKRITDQTDTERYQTIYAKESGSVAAPTAGLHFTTALFESLKQKNISKGFVTLHVGAGTFKPVKSETMADHIMHAEWIDVNLDFIEILANHPHKVIAVGTTSTRTIESLYWMGVKLMNDPLLKQVQLGQWEVYGSPLNDTIVPCKEALTALAEWMKKNDLSRLFTQTQLLIAPGYRFRVVNALVTNYHQPRSTLLLLVAAAIGPDWKKIYDHALTSGYRFLSYGDGCLLFIE